MSVQRPAGVLVRLGELRLGEDFEAPLSRHHGVVVDWGYVEAAAPGNGHPCRLPAVRCRFGAVERDCSPRMLVLVPASRPHARLLRDETRWGTLLPGGAVPQGAVDSAAC